MNIKHRYVSRTEFFAGNCYSDTGRVLVAFYRDSRDMPRVELNTFLGYNAELTVDQVAAFGACLTYAAQSAHDLCPAGGHTSHVEIGDEKNFPTTAETFVAQRL